MISSTDVARIVLEELTKLQKEQHWGELVFKVSLKNGDPQQLAVVYEKTFRELQPVATKP